MPQIRRVESDEVHSFVSPFLELNVGLWSLFVGTTAFLAIRLWVKLSRKHKLWYDDYILVVCWGILLANNSLIVHEFATGYILRDSSEEWDDRMHILINISSCGTLVGQAWTKTAFAAMLTRVSNSWQKALLWFCIATMNLFMLSKVILQWAKVCGSPGYDNWYRLDFCVDSKFRDDFKEAGNIYNITMDFLLASIPWIITRPLEMRRIEKVGLCVTMSLGMVVAIVSAIRVSWKDKGNDRDAYYIYRNGLSQVWYSSEITGTIIVQCIPILRTLIRDAHSSWVSKRRSGISAAGGGPDSWSKLSPHRLSAVTPPSPTDRDKIAKRVESRASWGEGKRHAQHFEQRSNSMSSLSSDDNRGASSHCEVSTPPNEGIWPLAPSPKSLPIRTTKSFTMEFTSRRAPHAKKPSNPPPILDWDSPGGATV